MTGASVLTVVGHVPPQHAVLLACALFAIGILGVTCRRNVLGVLLSVEILLNAPNLAFVAFPQGEGNGRDALYGTSGASGTGRSTAPAIDLEIPAKTETAIFALG